MRFSRLAIVSLLFASVAHAQFKWVDASGRVGYGDKPPAGAHDIEALGGYVKGGPRDPLARLPFQLQRTIHDFPVTLYTMSECGGCDTGRSLLKARAVPFSERTVRSADDAAALKKLSGGDRLPVFQIGSRTVTGFNADEWDEALDLAGYPRTNQLPADWTWPAPTPLTGVTPAAAETTTPSAASNPQ
jgi:hypothetical protein